MSEEVSVSKELFDQSQVTDTMRKFSKIKQYFPDKLIKLFYYYTMSYELGDNNRKAELFELIMDRVFNGRFLKLGTGTNRIAFRRGNFVYKIALDRRGLVDNLSEAKRSPECPNFFALTYETNALIAVSEYVGLLDQETFNVNQSTILEMLSELAKQYIFGDMGYTAKNYCNFGYRQATSKRDATLVVLDYAYCHPRFTNEDALICPNCGSEIIYNANYTGFRCSNPNCGIEYSYLDIKRRLDTSYENLENMYLSNLSLLDTPDLEDITFHLDDDNITALDFIEDEMDEGQYVPIRKSKLNMNDPENTMIVHDSE